MGGGAAAGVRAGAAGGDAYVRGGGSSEDTAAPPPFGPRLSLILKSCFSSSNSVTEFFLIRSIMALMSFKSTAVYVRVNVRCCFLSNPIQPSQGQQPRLDSAFDLFTRINNPPKAVNKQIFACFPSGEPIRTTAETALLRAILTSR